VERIGQAHVVRALNLTLEETVEYRVREVLEEKLAIILQEFGVDKTGDVLDSAESGAIFDELYAAAIVDPARVEAQVNAVVSRVREQAQTAKEGASVLASDTPLDPHLARQMAEHPMPYWIERMTTAYLESGGGQAVREEHGWRLVWPDGVEWRDVLFSPPDAGQRGARVLTLEEPRVRGLATALPRFVPGQPVPALRLADLPAEVRGWWSLWRIGVHSADWNRHRIMPLFMHDDGRLLGPTARHLWDLLLQDHHTTIMPVEAAAAQAAFDAITRAAEAQGRALYEQLRGEHRSRLEQERDKGSFAFQSRRRAVERIGLPAVRAHRLSQLEDEERAWGEAVERRERIEPDLVPLIMVRIDGAA
jgi:hypothetical protein